MAPTTHHQRSADHALVRELNLSLILKQLDAAAPLSRADLADRTGLNKSTVSSLIQELTEHGFVRELGYSTGGMGRPSLLLELDPDAGYALSTEIGVNFIAVTCSAFTGHPIWSHLEYRPANTPQDDVITRTLELLRTAATHAHSDRCLGVALGIPGLIDARTGSLLFAPNLGWRDVPLRDILEDAFLGTRVIVENEARLAAQGELISGAAQGYQAVLYISAGIGLGGAVIRSGLLETGTAGYASEFGHMTMDPDGLPCACGSRGCWETQVSESALFRYAREYTATSGSPILTKLAGPELENLTLAHITSAADQGDPAALFALEKTGHYLGIGIASLVNALNPDVVVFGGVLSSAEDYLIVPIQKELKRRALRWNADAATLVLADFRREACVMGGIATVRQAVISEPERLIRQ